MSGSDMDKANMGDKGPIELPPCAEQFIAEVTRRMRYRKRVRLEVSEELAAHFEDELRDCADTQERERRAKQLIEEFGDPKLLAVLCRRAKKRCRRLWWKVFIRTVQVILVLGLYVMACSFPLFLGKPTIRVNYVDRLNERWRPAQAQAENAKRYYDQAVALYVQAPETLEVKSWNMRDCNEVDLRLLGTWLSENEPAFEMVRRGANTRNYWPVYDANDALLNNTMPFWLQAHVMQQALEATAGYRPMSHALNSWIVYRARLGDANEAIADCLSLVRFGRHLEGKGLEAEQLDGIAIEKCGYGALFEVLQEAEISIEVLNHVQDQLAAGFKADRQVISFDAEKAFWYDNIQRVFTDDGHGGGHVLPYGLPLAAGDWRRNLAGIFLFDYPDRREAIEEADRYFARVQEALHAPPKNGTLSWQAGGSGGTESLGLMLSITAPADEGLAQLAWRVKTSEAAAITIVGVFRYKAGKGSYPSSLEDVVQAGILARLPDDPFGQGPLTYSKTGDGFRLYSWGENLIDDGGRQGIGQDGTPRAYAANGDWVFWPVKQE